MKIVCSLLVAFLAIQAIRADDTTPATPKPCKDFLPEATCTQLQNLISKLKESSSTLRDAVQAAIKAHKTKAAEMLTFIKQYIADNIKCDQVLNDDSCKKLNDVAKTLKLSALQVKEAIEKAVASGKTTLKAIYDNAVTTLTGEISCEKILGDDTCKKLFEAAKTLKEQRILIQEALMTAAQKHISNLKDMAKSVRERLVQAATNFDCTDVLSQDQCTRLQDIATRFKLRAGELRRVLAEAIVNGKVSATELYKATIGAFLDEVKDTKCGDLLPQTTCDALDKSAERYRQTKAQVTEAVKEWIISGKEKVTNVTTFVKTIFIDMESCKNFFVLMPSICEKLQKTALRAGITFNKVVTKIKELYQSGTESLMSIYQKIKKLLTGDSVVKRSIQDDNDVMKKVKELKEKLKRVLKEYNAKLEKLTGPAKSLLKEAIKNFKENLEKEIKKLLGKTKGTL